MNNKGTNHTEASLCIYCLDVAKGMVEGDVPDFHINCALLETSLTLSAFVLQTLLIKKSIIANAIFFIFKTATMIFKMAAKLIIFQQIKVPRDFLTYFSPPGQFFIRATLFPGTPLIHKNVSKNP